MKKLLFLLILLAFSTTALADLTGTEGLAIDLSSAGAGTDFTIAFDPTEFLGSRTWGDASTDTIVWTWNRATGTDPTITFNSGSIGLPALTLVTPLVLNYGGFGADVSGYTGLVAITGGATAEVDSLSELTGHLADVTRIVTEAVMPVASADPDVDASGELAIDTDGANEPNDVVLRTSSVSGNQQYALAQVLKSIQCTIIKPNDLADATRDACPIWENNTGMTFVITMIRAWSDTDNTTVNVETVDSDWDNNATVDLLEIATDEVANFSVEETTITAATIAAGSLIVLDFDDTDDPGWVKFNIMGYFNADVD